MSSISLLLTNVNGAAVQTDATRSTGAGLRALGIGDGSPKAAFLFESILRQQAGGAEREEPAPRVDLRDERSDEVAGPAEDADHNELTTMPTDDSPAVVNDAPAAEPDEQAPPPASGVLHTAAANQTVAVEQVPLVTQQGQQATPAELAISHTAAANQTMAVQQGPLGTQQGLEALHAAAVDHAAEAGQAGGADPSAFLSRGGKLGLNVQQMIEPTGHSLQDPPQVGPDGPIEIGDVAPVAEDVVTALSTQDKKPVRLPVDAELPVFDTLSRGDEAQTDFRELTLSFLGNKRLHQTPLSHHNGPDISSTSGHEAGHTAAHAMTSATTFASAETSPARPIAQQLATRVVSWAEIAKDEGRTVFHLRLDPPRLGSVRVELSATAKIVSVKLIASNQAAGNVLQAQLHELRQSLTEAEVSFANLDVSYDESGSQGPALQRELNPYSPWHGDTGGEGDEQPVAWQWRSRSETLIDVLA